MHINSGTPSLVNSSTHLLSDHANKEKGEGHIEATPKSSNNGEKGSNTISSYSLNLSSQTNSQHTSLTYQATYSVNPQVNSQANPQVNSHTSALSATTAISEPAPLLDGASNILSFIEQRVASEQASGASLEDLDELLQQGLAGFVQGYDEARVILGQQDSLNETVDGSISLLYHQVVDGIADLRQSYLGEEKPESTVLNNSTPLNNNTTADQSISFANNATSNNTSSIGSIASPINALMDQLNGPQDSKILTLLDSLEEMEQVKEYAAEYANTQDFTFELTTADGDTISITANRTSSTSASSQGEEGGLGNGLSKGLGTSASNTQNSQQFTFAIEGELDEGEIEAINDVMNQVMSLSEQFYNGDVGAAYQAALELDYDSSEISTYALQLKQTESYTVAAIYDDIGANSDPSTSSAATDLNTLLEEIGNYTQQLLQELVNPENYEKIHYAQIIDAVSQQLDQQISDDKPFTLNDSITTIMEKVGLST